MIFSNPFSDYAIHINRKRLTATASGITHIPAQFFTVTIKELPDANFGIGGKSIDEIKRNYKP